MLIGALTVIMTVIGLYDVAQSHEWYDSKCCNETHCHPVADGVVQEKADGVLVAGYGTVPYTDDRLHWSKDDRDHICVSNLLLLCVYRRVKSY